MGSCISARHDAGVWLAMAILLLLAPSAPVHGQVSTVERNALIDLYNATGGASWSDDTGWLGAQGTECTWFGVTCSSDPPTVVERLELPSNNLAGSIPASIGDLGSLRILDLHDNGLWGPIPAGIGNLASLGMLNLSENQLAGAVPSSLWGVTSLFGLYLDHNMLTGTIPAAIGGLTNLQRLDLGWNHLDGAIPEELYDLPTLYYLGLGHNALTGHISPAVGGLGTFTVDLDLSENQLTGPIPSEVCDLWELQALYLQGNQLIGGVPDCLGDLGELVALDLSGNDLEGPVPASLGNLALLQHLSLSSNGLSGPIPPEFCSLTSLQDLELDGNRLEGSIPDCLGNLPSLQWLGLDDNALEGSLPHTIGNLDQLIYLDVAGNRLAGALPAELTSLGNLTHLSVQYNALFSEDPLLGAWVEARDPGWRDTQTMPPGNLNDTSRTACSVVLEWDPASYLADPGGYWLWYATDSAGPYTRYPVPVRSKLHTSLRVTGLSSLSTYYFKASSYTDPHAANRNVVESLPGAEWAATTGITGTLNTDMDGDPAPSHEDLGYMLLYFFYGQVLTSADPNCDGVADAADLAALIAVVYP